MLTKVVAPVFMSVDSKDACFKETMMKASNFRIMFSVCTKAILGPAETD